MVLDFNNLLLERTIFEVRFKGRLYLDRCGQIWTETERKYPQMEAVRVQIDGATFELPDLSVTVRYSDKALNLHVDYPESLGDFCEAADFLVSLIRRTLEVDVFERVGSRFLFLLPVKTPEEATAVLLDSALVHLPPAKVALFGNELIEPSVRFVLQDDDQGYIVSLASISRELQARVPRPFSLDDRKFTRKALLTDMDRFTRKGVDAGTFVPSEFIKTTHKNISNNWGSLLRGGTK